MDWTDKAIDATLRNAFAQGMREAVKMVRTRRPCPFDDDKCSVKADDLCPVCGENSDGLNPKTNRSECKSAYLDICARANEIERGTDGAVEGRKT